MEVPANAHSCAAGRRVLLLKGDAIANGVLFCLICRYVVTLVAETESLTCVDLLSAKLPLFLPSEMGSCEVVTTDTWVVISSYFTVIRVYQLRE